VRIGIVTREWPPDVYGSAGVHVEHLVAALRSLPAGPDLAVHCFGGPRSDAAAHDVPAGLAGANGALQALGTDVEIAAALAGADLVHSHTWYANAAGLLASLVHGAPHVVTAHSLEPRRPWKAEQLGGGYRLSSWVERTAYLTADAVIAVSEGMRADVLAVYPELDPARVHVVHNGVDAEAYRPVPAPDVVRSLGVDPDRPYALFVGRITRQKAWRICWPPPSSCRRRPGSCCAPAPRTPPRSGSRSPTRSPRCRPVAPGWSGSRRCCPASNWSR
jgi:alpha-maltose-1-phosphate synthase